jgi:hypothetical protein
MQSYVSNYFSELKRDVDLTFFGNEGGDTQAKYLEIINKIEEIE